MPLGLGLALEKNDAVLDPHRLIGKPTRGAQDVLEASSDLVIRRPRLDLHRRGGLLGAGGRLRLL